MKVEFCKWNKYLILVVLSLIVVATVFVCSNSYVGNVVAEEVGEITSEEVDISNSPNVSGLWSNYVSSSSWSGSGTQNNPYCIRTSANLAYMAYLINSSQSGYASAYYKIINDVDMGIHYWVPISKDFSGHIDGNYKVINNLRICDYESSSYFSGDSTGFIENMKGGSIVNLGICGVDINITMTSITSALGVLCGTISSETAPITIENCWVRGNVVVNCNSDALYIGSIVGFSFQKNSYPKIIRNCFSGIDITPFVTNATYIGGIIGNVGSYDVGVNGSLLVDKCYYGGKITNYGDENKCYYSGIAGLVDYGTNNVHIFSNSYFNSSLLVGIGAVGTKDTTTYYSNNIVGSLCSGKTTAQMTTQATYVGWDFVDIWEFDTPDVPVEGVIYYPVLQGFTYPQTLYVTFTFYVKDVVAGVPTGDWYILNIQKFARGGAITSDDFITIPSRYAIVDQICYWAYTPEFDMSNLQCDVSFYLCYMDEQETVTIRFWNLVTMLQITERIAIPNTTYITRPNDPGVYGYTFDNWYTSTDCTTVFTFGVKVGNVDVNIYAKFNKNTYYIYYKTYDKYIVDGTGNWVQISSEAVLYQNQRAVIEGTTHTYEPVEVTGYTFGGWFYDEELTRPVPSNFVMPAYSINLYASFTKNPFIITFRADFEDISTSTVLYQEYILDEEIPDIPTKIGYTIVAPYWDFDFDTPITDDVTILAVYTINVYTVTFTYNSNLSSVIAQQGKSMNIVQQVEHGQDATTPILDQYQLYGYQFAGWSKSLENITQNQTIYANFSSSIVTLTFVSFSSRVTQDYLYGQEISLESVPNPATRVGYDKIAPYWDWESSGVSLSAVQSSAIVNAVYTVNTYEINFVDESGSIILTIMVNHGDEINAPNVATDLFEMVVYDQIFGRATSDMTIRVSVESYATQVYVGAAFAGVLILTIVLFSFIKRKKSSTMVVKGMRRLK